MKSAVPLTFVALMTALVFGAGPAAQIPAAPPPSSREALLAAARTIMESAHFCAAITTDRTGRPQARTVDPFPPESDMVVWFATNPKSRKVDELRRDPRVTLHYFDSRSPQLGYVTLLGRARLVDDPAEKQKRWKNEWQGLWPDRDRSYLLVEVTPDRIEVLSPKQGINNDPVTWAAQFVEFPRARPTKGR